MTMHRDIQGAPVVPQAAPEVVVETPRRRTTVWTIFWGFFGLMTLWSAIYQAAFVEDGAGWLPLTFLYVFAALMIWESVGLFSKLWKADR